MKHFYFILFLFTIPFSLSSQITPDSISVSLEQHYELPRESIFFHLNKTHFIKGEAIWFKGYIIDQRNFKPSLETTNIHVSLLDSLGNLKEDKLFLALDGNIEGVIKLDSTYTSGNYFLRAETSWMKNFQSSKPFLEKFRVLDETLDSNKPTVIEYDVQFLPEGGNMLVGTNNIIGVKSINNYGYGINIKNGKIYDQDDNFIKTFETTKHGLGKFLLFPESGKSYHAIIDFKDGSRKTYYLPDSNSKGISLSLMNNFEQENIAIKFNTNVNSLGPNGLLTAYYLIHKNGKSILQRLEFNESNLSRSILLKKEGIETGINAITLFNHDLKPISERKFFNNYNFKLPDIKLDNIQKNEDSVSLRLEIEGIEDNFNASISILPLETTNEPTNNILSQFYLQPYVTGFIENPAYYFEDFSREKLYHLELLLLNQGWSKYAWEEIFKGPKVISHPFEKGLTLIGKLNKTGDKENEILFHNSQYHLMKSIMLPAGENTLTFSGIYFSKEEKLKFSLIETNKKLSKPPIYFRVEKQYKPEKLQSQWIDNPEKSLGLKNNYEMIEFLNDFNTTELDKVELFGKKKEMIPRTRSIPSYLKSKVTMVDKELIFNFPNIIDLIRFKGYEVYEGLQAFDGGSPRDPISTVSIKSRRPGTGFRLIMDGVRMPSLDQLSNLSTSDVESFYFDKIGSFEGAMNGFNEILYLFTRIGPSLEDLNRSEIENILTFTPQIGFEKPQAYYSPKYSNYESEPFKKYGSVHWIPGVKSSNNSFDIKFPDYELEGVKLFIEGMSSNGVLISKAIRVNLNN